MRKEAVLLITLLKKQPIVLGMITSPPHSFKRSFPPGTALGGYILTLAANKRFKAGVKGARQLILHHLGLILRPSRIGSSSPIWRLNRTQQRCLSSLELLEYPELNVRCQGTHDSRHFMIVALIRELCL